MPSQESDNARESLSGSLHKAVSSEPAKAAALLYAWLTAVGFARLFGSGMPFGINAIDLSAPEDFLLGGFRDPIVGVLALVSALGLYWLWGRSLRDPRAHWLLAGVALAWLAACSGGSSIYRRAVVVGAWRDACFAPLTTTVILAKSAKEAGLDSISGRLILVTSRFLAFHIDPNRTIVVTKDTSLAWI